MRWFVETVDGEVLQVRDLERVAYDHDDDEVELTFGSGYKARCTAKEWAAVKGQHQYVPASPGIRLLLAPPYFKSVERGDPVVAWRLGGEFPVPVTTTGETECDLEYVGCLYPDGSVAGLDGGGTYPSLEHFEADHKERHEKWVAK